MNVYWLEQTDTALPPDDGWLVEREFETLSGLRFPKRRADWRLGRWTAKHAAAAYLGVEPALVEIRSAPSGAPEAFLAGDPAPVSISISHRAATALSVAGPRVATLGCDLELVEPRSATFIEDCFTLEEQSAIAHASSTARYRVVALLWSAKESALKALRTGLRLDTRSVAVSLGSGDAPNTWHPLQVRHRRQVFRGWWQFTDDVVRTVVADPPSIPPIAFSTIESRAAISCH